MNGAGKFFSGLIIGTAAGVVTGLLIAPTSGNQTRKNIMRKSRGYSQQAVDAVRQYLENIRQGKVKGDTAMSKSETEEILNRLTKERNS